MNFDELIKKRYSTRSYSPKPVSREIIDKCIESARLAPSACNSQPWYFIIIDDPEFKNLFCKSAFSGIYSMCSFADSAPVIIAVITEKSSYIAKIGGFFKGTQFCLIDIGIACEHLILQATEEGLGTCWIGWFDEKRVKKMLGLPKGKKVDILISMGYPKEETTHEKVRKPLNEIRKYFNDKYPPK